MPTPTIPFGPLQQWGSFIFVAGRSLLLPGWHVTRPSSRGHVAGQQVAYDRMGRTFLPVEFTLTWEYNLHCDPIGDTVSLQTQMDSLMAAYFAGQVQTLQVLKYGGGTVSGLASLEDITEVAGAPTFKKLNLQFFVSNGLQ